MEKKIYAEAFSIIGGLADIKLDIMSVDAVFDESGVVIGEKREVIQQIAVSLPVAKDLAIKLTQAIASYENAFGPIVELNEASKKRGEGTVNE